MIISRSFLLRMRNFTDKSCSENQNTHFMFNNHSQTPTPSPENRAVLLIVRKDIIEPDRPQMKKWRIFIACWIPKATNTLLEYVYLLLFLNGCTDAPQC